MISNVIEFLIKAGTDVFTTYSSIRPHMVKPQSITKGTEKRKSAENGMHEAASCINHIEKAGRVS